MPVSSFLRMELQHPLKVVTPTVDADVLAVLALLHQIHRQLLL